MDVRWRVALVTSTLLTSLEKLLHASNWRRVTLACIATCWDFFSENFLVFRSVIRFQMLDRSTSPKCLGAIVSLLTRLLVSRQENEKTRVCTLLNKHKFRHGGSKGQFMEKAFS
jgi:hypothetical protein